MDQNQIDPQQFAEFLKFQAMMKASQAQAPVAAETTAVGEVPEVAQVATTSTLETVPFTNNPGQDDQQITEVRQADTYGTGTESAQNLKLNNNKEDIIMNNTVTNESNNINPVQDVQSNTGIPNVEDVSDFNSPDDQQNAGVSKFNLYQGLMDKSDAIPNSSNDQKRDSSLLNKYRNNEEIAESLKFKHLVNSQERDQVELPEEKPMRKSNRLTKNVQGTSIYDQATKKLDSTSNENQIDSTTKKGREEVKKNENIEMETEEESEPEEQIDYKKKITSPVNSSNQVYDCTWVHENNANDDIKCDVCLGKDDNEGDEIVVCDSCNAAAHQSCYGKDVIKDIPDENQDWFCERCTYLQENQQTPELINCNFCSDIKGIFTKTNFGWVHTTCINWMPDMWFSDENYSEVRGQVNQEKKNLCCYICKERNEKSLCIQCDFQNCRKTFHIRCGIKDGIIQDWETMNDHRQKEESSDCYLFCKEHKQDGIHVLQTQGVSGLQEIDELEYRKRQDLRIDNKRLQAKLSKKQRDIDVDNSMDDNDNKGNKIRNEMRYPIDDPDDEEFEVDEASDKSNTDDKSSGSDDQAYKDITNNRSIRPKRSHGFKQKPAASIKINQGYNTHDKNRVVAPNRNGKKKPVQQSFNNSFFQKKNSAVEVKNKVLETNTNNMVSQILSTKAMNNQQKTVQNNYNQFQNAQPNFNQMPNPTIINQLNNQMTAPQAANPMATMQQMQQMDPGAFQASMMQMMQGMIQQQNMAAQQVQPVQQMGMQGMMNQQQQMAQPNIPNDMQSQMAFVFNQQNMQNQGASVDLTTSASSYNGSTPNKKMNDPPQKSTVTGSRFKVDPKFAKLIGVAKDETNQHITDRLSLQQKFINYAICNNLVTEHDHNYCLDGQPYLKQKIGKTSFDPKQLFNHLQVFLTPC